VSSCIKPGLTIGQVEELTGIKPGRVRIYEATGLVSLGYRERGWRRFSENDVLRLLHIDLLRSSGMGLEAIRRTVSTYMGDVRAALDRHAALIRAERDRLGRVLEVVESAIERAELEISDDTSIERLMKVKRDAHEVQ
jgi:DNA-binding transcriptional MerR regulator